jgi:demethylmenaquinone methyltransferase/2-methoxy-6-polyprenyl-1,4-benzoquinol methylase
MNPPVTQEGKIMPPVPGSRDTAEPSRVAVWSMFDRIAHRYDLLNRILSMGIDVRWRKRLGRYLPEGDGLRLLDLATGTGDVMLMLHGMSSRVTSGVGMDMSGGMLGLGRRKIAREGLADSFAMVRADALAVAVPDDQFDVVTIAFGIRNVLDVMKGLQEMQRVLKPGGRALILEFSLPRIRLLRVCYLWYFRTILPRLGALISGDAHAYRYLNKTVETFPHGEAFCDLMSEAGFKHVKAHPLTFGIATIYQGDK